jgi:hypothetical protein
LVAIKLGFCIFIPLTGIWFIRGLACPFTNILCVKIPLSYFIHIWKTYYQDSSYVDLFGDFDSCLHLQLVGFVAFVAVAVAGAFAAAVAVEASYVVAFVFLLVDCLQ